MLINVKPKGGDNVTDSIKAQVAQISAGNISIEGLIDDAGREYVSVPQVCALFSLGAMQASRSIKGFMPKSFEFIKASVFQGEKRFRPRDVNALPIESFMVLLAALDRAGNVSAQTLNDRVRFPGETSIPSKKVKSFADSQGVYVIGNKAMGFCKIGIACDVQRRLKSIQTGCPYPLEVWFFKPMKKARSIERQLHQQFSSYQMSGEWFSAKVFELVDWKNLHLAPIDAVNRAADANLLEPSDFRI
jgi:hypothetical protein